MSNPVCPYCRTPVEAGDGGMECGSCHTPHHQECWEENGGCTVFGCAEAPVEEAKIVVGAGELPGAFSAVNAAATTGVAPPPPPPGLALEPYGTFSAPAYEPLAGANSLFGVSGTSSVQRLTFVLLAVFFGFLGAHNLYANRTSIGIIQLCITLMSCLAGLPVTWIWALVEAATVDRDGEGYLMR